MASNYTGRMQTHEGDKSLETSEERTAIGHTITAMPKGRQDLTPDLDLHRPTWTQLEIMELEFVYSW